MNVYDIIYIESNFLLKDFYIHFLSLLADYSHLDETCMYAHISVSLVVVYLVSQSD